MLRRGVFGIGRKIVGIDIGFESIKIVGVSHQGKQSRVVGFHEIPLDGPIIESDHIKDKNKIAELLKRALRESKPQALNFKIGITVMPEFLVFSKTIQLPKTENEKELKTATLSQAGQYIPVPLSEVNIDSQVLIAHPNEPIVDVLVTATPKALVNEYLETYSLAGINIVAIETKPIAAARALIAPNETSGILILEIGTVTSRISIVDKSQIRFVSTINTGGDQIIRQMAGVNLKREEFLKEKYARGLTQQPEKAKIAIEKIVENLVKAIRYHQTRDFQAGRILEIRVCGSGALIPGICPAIESEIKIKTVLAKYYLKQLPTGLDQRFAVSLGLALNPTNF